MRTLERTEAQLCAANHVLVVSADEAPEGLIRDFFGAVVTPDDLEADTTDCAKKTVYLGADLSKVNRQRLQAAERILVIQELATGCNAAYEDKRSGADKDDQGGTGQFETIVDLGWVPIRIHDVGVFYRRFFDPSVAYFQRICAEHTFQSLTESTKSGTAHRTGIYLTPVQQDDAGLHFRLLRCSTNLSGPTENFRATDQYLVDALNQAAAGIFQHQAPLNHVLAQVYHNTPADEQRKQSKARISAHADKTKDMPANGIMAFCTFYDQLDKLQPLTKDPFDLGYKNISGLTRLHFRLKESAGVPHEGSLPTQFTLTLYPNSVFFMPLSTNRLYTHEIQPATLDAALLPTRLGYVVRCSSTEALHTNGQTFLKQGGNLVPLEPPTPEGMSELRQLYVAENKTQAVIDYGNQFLFSMNTGDYLAPQY